MSWGDGGNRWQGCLPHCNRVQWRALDVRTAQAKQALPVCA